jgi:hypothetical protein
MYSLIFAERNIHSGSIQAALNGPFIFRKEAKAWSKLFEYVSGRIVSDLGDLFVEEAEGMGIDLMAFTTDDDEPALKEEVKACLDSLDAEKIEAVINFYFNYADNEEYESFYVIEAIDFEE